MDLKNLTSKRPWLQDSWILLPHLFFPGFLSGLMELKAVKRGIIVIWAPETSRFLCMDHTGHLYTSISLMPAIDCLGNRWYGGKNYSQRNQESGVHAVQLKNVTQGCSTGFLNFISYQEEACNFRETILQDGYNVYFSESYNLPISLSSRRNLSPDQPLPPFSQFLPLVNMIPLEPESVDDTSQNQEPDVESDDPFNMLGKKP
ncbi:fibroblast growth factor 21-like [Varanus komodoensis]|uniref:fibroblast growth factor 21-like n=1 Tax=Varanus komodoensis TaxID=61221 RepID=UPI001CF78872|nr:fibroblast growth factor 21-like [Varanus komodoensis]